MCSIVRVCRHAWNERFEWKRKKECELVKASVMMCHHHLFWTNLYAIHQRASFCCWGCGGRRRRRWRRERERVFAHLQWVKRCASVCFFIICHILRIVFGFCMLRHSRIASRSHTKITVECRISFEFKYDVRLLVEKLLRMHVCPWIIRRECAIWSKSSYWNGKSKCDKCITGKKKKRKNRHTLCLYIWWNEGTWQI